MARERSQRNAVVFGTALVLTLVLLFRTNWHVGKHPAHTAAGGTSPSITASPSSTASPESSTPAAASTKKMSPPPPTHAQLVAAATAKVKALAKGWPSGGISVAEVNISTGASYHYGPSTGMWTASVYKLFVLETLLVQNGGPLSGVEAEQATTMIENSDNVAGYALFEAAGGRAGLSKGAASLGLKHTIPGVADPTFTNTGAADMLTLLRNLTHSGPLNAASRNYALRLMRNVEGDQRWGVGVVADKGTTFANKNGWLSIDNDNGPDEDDDGRWVVNSLGIVTVHGHEVLMAVMTEHGPDFQTGVDLVQSLSRAIIGAVAA